MESPQPKGKNMYDITSKTEQIEALTKRLELSLALKKEAKRRRRLLAGEPPEVPMTDEELAELVRRARAANDVMEVEMMQREGMI